MKKLREIKDFDTLDDFKLSDPAMTVDIELSNEDMQNLEINRSSFLEKSDRAKLVLKAILNQKI